MKTAGVTDTLVVLLCLWGTLAFCDELPKREERKSKSVTSFVSAKWETTPIVLELAEYLAGESADLFWSFVDGINSLKTSLDSLGKISILTCNHSPFPTVGVVILK